MYTWKLDQTLRGFNFTLLSKWCSYASQYINYDNKNVFWFPLIGKPLESKNYNMSSWKENYITQHIISRRGYIIFKINLIQGDLKGCVNSVKEEHICFLRCANMYLYSVLTWNLSSNANIIIYHQSPEDFILLSHTNTQDAFVDIRLDTMHYAAILY